jgi:hypothetical protein
MEEANVDGEADAYEHEYGLAAAAGALTAFHGQE